MLVECAAIFAQLQDWGGQGEYLAEPLAQRRHPATQQLAVCDREKISLASTSSSGYTEIASSGEMCEGHTTSEAR